MLAVRPNFSQYVVSLLEFGFAEALAMLCIDLIAFMQQIGIDRLVDVHLRYMQRGERVSATHAHSYKFAVCGGLMLSDAFLM